MSFNVCFTRVRACAHPLTHLCAWGRLARIDLCRLPFCLTLCLCLCFESTPAQCSTPGQAVRVRHTHATGKGQPELHELVQLKGCAQHAACRRLHKLTDRGNKRQRDDEAGHASRRRGRSRVTTRSAPYPDRLFQVDHFLGQCRNCCKLVKLNKEVALGLRSFHVNLRVPLSVVSHGFALRFGFWLPFAYFHTGIYPQLSFNATSFLQFQHLEGVPNRIAEMQRTKILRETPTHYPRGCHHIISGSPPVKCVTNFYPF